MQSGNKQKTLGNFFSLSLLQIGNYVLPLITLPLISRIIGPDNYGVISYAFAYVGYFVLLINAGFDVYGSRVITSNKNNREALNSAFNNIIAAKFLLLIVAAVIFFSSISFINQLRHEKIAAFFTFLICAGWVINPSWLYHGMQDSTKYAWFSFLSKLIFSVAVVLMVREKDDYIYHPLITSLSHILVSAVSFFYAKRKYSLSLRMIAPTEIFQTIKANFKLSAIWWITNQSMSTNIVLAGFVLSTLEVGYYSAAFRIIIILQSIFSMPMNTVLLPYLSQSFNEGRQGGMEKFRKVFPFICLISAGIALITFLLAKPVILIFYGNEFAEAVFLLKILSAALFFATINGVFGQQVLLNLQKEGLYMKYVLAAMLVNIVLLYFFIYFYGLTGAVLAWPVSEVVLLTVYLAYFRIRNIRIIQSEYYKPRFMINNLMEIIKLRRIKKAI